VRDGEYEDVVLDPRARQELGARLDGLREDIADAERTNDAGRLTRARAERAAIEDALAAAFGVGGRARRRGHPVERARKAVYNRIRAALATIETAHAALGRHLACSVTTGTYCTYRPDRPTPWRLAPSD
jgi:hypothetical protein